MRIFQYVNMGECTRERKSTNCVCFTIRLGGEILLSQILCGPFEMWSQGGTKFDGFCVFRTLQSKGTFSLKKTCELASFVDKTFLELPKNSKNHHS